MDEFAGIAKVVDVSFGGSDIDADACSGLHVAWAVEREWECVEESLTGVFRAMLPDAKRRLCWDGAENGNGVAKQRFDHR